MNQTGTQQEKQEPILETLHRHSWWHFEQKYLHQLNPYIQNTTITGKTSTHFGSIIPNYVNNYVAKL